MFHYSYSKHNTPILKKMLLLIVNSMLTLTVLIYLMVTCKDGSKCSKCCLKFCCKCCCTRKTTQITPAKKNVLKSEHPEDQYTGLQPIIKPPTLKDDKDKEQQIREGKNQPVKNKKYDTINDFENMKSLVEEKVQKPPKDASKKVITPPPAPHTPYKSRKSKLSEIKSAEISIQKIPEYKKPAKEEPVQWNVKEDELKKAKIQDGLVAAPKDPFYGTLMGDVLEVLEHDDESKPKEDKIEIEQKIEKIKSGAMVNQTDPNYATMNIALEMPIQ